VRPFDVQDLAGYAYAIVTLLSRGYVVTMSDYKARHQRGTTLSLDGPTLGNNMIDAVRAARGVNRHQYELGGGRQWPGWTGGWRRRNGRGTTEPGLNMVGAVALFTVSAELVALATLAEQGRAELYSTRESGCCLQNMPQHIPRRFDPSMPTGRSPIPARQDQWACLTDCAPANPRRGPEDRRKDKADDRVPARRRRGRRDGRDELSAPALPGQTRVRPSRR